MADSYANVTIRHDDAMTVANAVAQMHRFNVISPVDQGSVVVFDRESDVNGELIVDFARIISKDLESTAMAVLNHQDSVLLYWLFDSGKELDTYVSHPTFFGEPMDRGGDAITLGNAWSRHDRVEQLTEILHGDVNATDRLKSETLRHADLVGALGISHWAAGFGYTRLANDDFPDGFPADDTFYTEPG